jgi:hypothetical protein
LRGRRAGLLRLPDTTAPGISSVFGDAAAANWGQPPKSRPPPPVLPSRKARAGKERGQEGVCGVPVILRFLLFVAILAGCVYGGMLALVAFYEPDQREISVTIPSSKLTPR